ncbi:tyrosine-type recombinase/integrase [Spirillospora sp. CA-294931]|uniref:tyrosine-type recombinase/integrase n=1 Tax=Spirillospora sp. CA-294931 TaxID=3240042 RepID=UPI003D90A0C6
MSPDPSPAVPPRPGARAAALPAAVAGVLADYERCLALPGETLNAGSIRVYRSRVRQFLGWLAGAMADGSLVGDPLTDPGARDAAARAYRTHLETVAGRRAATINAHLTAIDDLYRRRGLGPAAIRRAALPPSAPRTLDEHEQLRLLRAAERAPLRDRAIAFTAFYAGTLIGEIAALDTADVRISEGESRLTVRKGGTGKARQVPLHPRLRAVLADWLDERATRGGAESNPALFLNRRGGRLSARSAYTALRAVADAADLPVGRDGVFTPRVLRDTAGTVMARQGTDIAVVAELLGHSLETARRYSRPTDQDRERAIERLITDD